MDIAKILKQVEAMVAGLLKIGFRGQVHFTLHVDAETQSVKLATELALML